MTTLSPAEYYSTVLPEQYRNALQGAEPGVLDQPELATTIEITGAGGGSHGLHARGSTLIYEPGGVSKPDIHTRISIEDWRASIESGVAEQLIDYVLRRKVDLVKTIKGTVILELERSDGSIFENTTIFMGHAEPAVTLMMTTDDYAAMARGELNGQMAFMMGKLKFEGSLPLLMMIGALAD
jgi:putative sterol carrier protein